MDDTVAFHIRQAFSHLGPRPAAMPTPPPPLTREVIARDVRAAFAELDMRQLTISRCLSPAQRWGQVCELNRFLRHAAIAAIGQQYPGISEEDLQRQLLRRMGIHDERARI